MDYIVTVDDTLVPRVETGFSNQYGYQSTVSDAQGNQVPNPQTPAQFLVQQLLLFIQNSVTANEITVAAQKARDQATSSAVVLIQTAVAPPIKLV